MAISPGASVGVPIVVFFGACEYRARVYLGGGFGQSAERLTGDVWGRDASFANSAEDGGSLAAEC